MLSAFGLIQTRISNSSFLLYGQIFLNILSGVVWFGLFVVLVLTFVCLGFFFVLGVWFCLFCSFLVGSSVWFFGGWVGFLLGYFFLLGWLFVLCRGRLLLLTTGVDVVFHRN